MPSLDPALILARAKSVLDKLALSAPWTASLHGATLDTSVIFVSFLYADTGALPSLPHYAITMIRRVGGISARFAFNSETAEFLEAEGIKKPGTFLPPYVATDAAHAAFAPPLSTPEIVWRPCRESSTRFAPFWRYTVGTSVRYVRSDGHIYDNLTTQIRG